MSRNTLCIHLLLLLLLLSHHATARHYPILTSAPSTALPAAAAERDGAYQVTTPFTNHKQRAFHGREVKNCMPKGSRRSSAPSRFVNYHTFGSASRCGSAGHPPPATTP